jgi:UDP-N-acetylglucosamine--N-acetylmuramyl-(pentapeptide) pyrophosphoryl-undecaprenol N-acetylglucosamine transferase
MTTVKRLGDLRSRRGAIVVATGGHLEQALRRVDQLGLSSTVTFFVPRNSQSETRLRGVKHKYVENVSSRDLLGLVLVIVQLLLKIKKNDYDYVLSTGAGVAIACRVVCKLKGIDFLYIESIARQSSPSLTGRILVQMRTKNLFTESKFFDQAKWKPIDSLFNEYQPYDRDSTKFATDSLKIFVTVGTVHKFEFRRLVDLVNSVLIESDIVTWQLGPLDSLSLQGDVYKELTSAEFAQNVNEADVVISHSGVGSVLNILDAGKFPILIPRRPELGEHIDNHQTEITSVLRNLNLCTSISENLQRSHLVYACLKGVRPVKAQ